eukprot:s1671_g9.t1
MDFEKFCDLLKANHVDLERFGKGTANTLSQFYETAEKCLLKVEDSRLFRLVELVRINLHFRTDEGHQLELRIKSEVTAGGQLRKRNQPLAVVLRNNEHGQWEQAVERCLSTKFGLSPAAQKACFNMPKDAYTYQETQGSSETVPGIPTKYKTHTIKMTVQGVQHWTWTRVSNNSEEELMTLLQSFGVSVDQFTWQSFADRTFPWLIHPDLYDEVYEKKHSKLEPVGGELVRRVRIIKVWIWANAMMESFEDTLAAKCWENNVQAEGPSSAKTELADGAKVKKEKNAEQGISFEGQDQEKMEMDDFWLRVKCEIWEEIEQEEQACESSRLDDLNPGKILMKEEMEEEPKHNEAFEILHSQSGPSEVAAQEREVKESDKAAKSQTSVEPEPKPGAKRRRLTRRDMQKNMQTEGPSSVKTELADGVKIKKEKNAEQEISFEGHHLWLRVHKKVNEQFLVKCVAASSATENALKPAESGSGASQVQTSSHQQLEPRACGMEDASKSKADEDGFRV